MVTNLKRVYHIKILAYIILSFCFLKYYFIDTFLEFTQGSSTFSVLNQEVDKLPIPHPILCFNPFLKPSSTEQYGISTLTTETKHSYNLTHWELLKKLSYVNNEDFELSLTDNDVKIPFKVWPISTTRHGLCYLIDHDFEVQLKEGEALLEIKFNLPKKDLPNEVKVWLNPKDAWHGIVLDDWLYIDPVKLVIPVKESYDQLWSVKMSQTDLEYRIGVENFTDCMEKYIENQVNCTRKCFPIIFNFLGLPACQYNESKCMFEALIKSRTGRYHCLKLKNTIQYKVDFHFTYELKKKFTGVKFLMYFDRLTKDIKRERLVVTTADFIGSVGGSLGLFLGFSCFTFLSGFFEKILSILVK